MGGETDESKEVRVRLQSIWPFVLFLCEKDEKVDIEDFLKALKKFKKKHGDKLISQESLKEAREYYEGLLKSEQVK